MAEPEIYWTGASQKRYGYWSYPLLFTCNAGQNGNYIFTKVVNNVWVPIYIGQGDLNERINDPTHSECAAAKGATHVHVHTNSSEQDRLVEEADILANHPNAYAPTGCNEKIGG